VESTHRKKQRVFGETLQRLDQKRLQIETTATRARHGSLSNTQSSPVEKATQRSCDSEWYPEELGKFTILLGHVLQSGKGRRLIGTIMLIVLQGLFLQQEKKTRNNEFQNIKAAEKRYQK